jgi:hypothetical protein
MLKTKEEIEKYMERFGGMDDWTFNEKMEVDVPGNIELRRSFFPSGEFPFQFGTISGWFDCSKASLKSLIGAPHTVKGDFDCSNNQLSSLDGSPKFAKSYDCQNNPIASIGDIETNISGVFIGPELPEFSSFAKQNLSLDLLANRSMVVDADDFNSKVAELKIIREEKALLEGQLAKLVEPYDRAKEGPLPSEKANKPKMKHKI